MLVICKFPDSATSDRFCDSHGTSEIMATYHLPGKGSFCLLDQPPAKVCFAWFDGSVEEAEDVLKEFGWQGILDRQSAAA